MLDSKLVCQKAYQLITDCEDEQSSTDDVETRVALDGMIEGVYEFLGRLGLPSNWGDLSEVVKGC